MGSLVFSEFFLFSSATHFRWPCDEEAMGMRKLIQTCALQEEAIFDYFLFTSHSVVLHLYFLQDKRDLSTEELRKQPRGFFASVKRY